MTITVIELGSAAFDSAPLASSGTATITTIANAPAGCAILVIAGGDALSTKVNVVQLTNCRDSASNTYGARQDGTTTNVQTGFFLAPNAALSSGGTISVDFITSPTLSLTQHMSIKAYAVTGVDTVTPLDDHAHAATSSSTTTPSATGAILAIATEAVFGYCYVKGAAAGGDAFTEASGFTSGSVASNSNSNLQSAYQIVSLTAAVTYAPTLGTARAAGWNILSLKGSADVTVNLTGVGGAGAIGALTTDIVAPLTGQAGISSLGVITPNFIIPLAINLLAFSQPNKAQLAVKGGTISDTSPPIDATALADTWLHVGAPGVLTFGYQTPSMLASTTYKMSCLIEMDDGSVPVMSASSITGDFGFVIAGGLATAGTVTNVTGNCYVATTVHTTPGTITLNNTGIIQYDTMSGKPFKVSRFAIERYVKGSTGTLSPAIGAALIGLAAAGALGTLAPGLGLALTGAGATGAGGSLSPGLGAALAGLGAAGASGSLSPALALPLAGVAGLGALGSVTVALAAPVAGVGAAALAGTLSPIFGLQLVGNAASGSLGIFSVSSVIALTGVAGVGDVGQLATVVFTASIDRTYAVAAQERNFTIVAENRVAAIANQERNFVIDAQGRTLVLSAEDRGLVVPANDRTLGVGE